MVSPAHFGVTSTRGVTGTFWWSYLAWWFLNARASDARAHALINHQAHCGKTHVVKGTRFSVCNLRGDWGTALAEYMRVQPHYLFLLIKL